MEDNSVREKTYSKSNHSAMTQQEAVAAAVTAAAGGGDVNSFTAARDGSYDVESDDSDDSHVEDVST